MRHEHRSAARYRCDWLTHFGERDLGHVGHTHDVSETGAFIIGGALPKVGALLRLCFDGRGAPPVLLGQVVRHAAAVPRVGAPAGFGVHLLGDRLVMRELLRARLNAPASARAGLPTRPGAQGLFHRRFSTEPEYREALTAELGLGALSFSSSTPISLNREADVEVSFRWSTRRVQVAGRVVRATEAPGRFDGVLLLDDGAGSLARLNEAAGLSATPHPPERRK
jgi:hypothetical protein